MIQKMSILKDNGDRLVLFPSADYAVDLENLEGLGPVNADIHSSSIAGSYGSLYASAHIGVRNIVIPIYFRGPHVERKRLALYPFFRPAQHVTFCITTDTLDLTAEAYVEALPGPSRSPDVMQASLLCMDPFFHSANESELSTRTVTDAFEFPFSITSDGIPFSTIANGGKIVVDNGGGVDVGMEIAMSFTGGVVNPVIRNETTEEYFGVKGTFLAGDVLTVNTQRGKKGITLLRGGDSQNLLNSMASGSRWLVMPPGESVFSVDADSGSGYVSISFRKTELYVGV